VAHRPDLHRATREATELRLRLHAVPVLGHHELRNLQPSIIQAWLRGLQNKIAPSYVRTVLTNTSAVLNAAVDDGLIPSNPCKAKSVRPPKVDWDKVEPWPVAQVESVIERLPERYRALAVVGAGCGLRQGEIFGLRVQDVEYLRRRIQVQQHVKLVRGHLTIDKPKSRRTRTVPLPD
jgi:integrase